MSCSKEIVVVFLSYVLGCVSAGYYLVRIFAGKDIRTIGSGGTGARNVSRLLGKTAFWMVFLLDMLKGLIVAAAGLFLKIHPAAVMASLIAVLCGHIWPVQLGFRGGRGLTVLIGFLLVFDFWVLAVALVVFGLCVLILKKYEISVFIGLAAIPLFVFLKEHSKFDVYGILFAVIIILLAHRHHIIAFFEEFQKK